jgi:hypothetical protein
LPDKYNQDGVVTQWSPSYPPFYPSAHPARGLPKAFRAPSVVLSARRRPDAIELSLEPASAWGGSPTEAAQRPRQRFRTRIRCIDRCQDGQVLLRAYVPCRNPD